MVWVFIMISYIILFPNAASLPCYNTLLEANNTVDSHNHVVTPYWNQKLQFIVRNRIVLCSLNLQSIKASILCFNWIWNSWDLISKMFYLFISILVLDSRTAMVLLVMVVVVKVFIKLWMRMKTGCMREDNLGRIVCLVEER